MPSPWYTSSCGGSVVQWDRQHSGIVLPGGPYARRPGGWLWRMYERDDACCLVRAVRGEAESFEAAVQAAEDTYMNRDDQGTATRLEEQRAVAGEEAPSASPPASTFPATATHQSVESTRGSILSWMRTACRKVCKHEVMEAFGLTSAQALHDLRQLAQAGEVVWTWDAGLHASVFEVADDPCPHCLGGGMVVEGPDPGGEPSEAPAICAVCGSTGRVEHARTLEYERCAGVLHARLVAANGMAYNVEPGDGDGEDR